MEPRRPKALAWLLLIAYACTSAFWAKGLVLCFEPDGHVTIESATSDCSDCCTTSETRTASEGTQDGSGEGPTLGACACVDVALAIGNFTAAKKSPAAELQRAPLAVSVVVPWTPHVRFAPVLSNDLPRSHASVALTFLNSVVLRV